MLRIGIKLVFAFWYWDIAVCCHWKFLTILRNVVVVVNCTLFLFVASQFHTLPTRLAWFLLRILCCSQSEDHHSENNLVKFLLHIKVICKVRRLGGENGQFWHNRGIKCWTGNEILQNETTTGTQTSFSTNLVSKLSFIPSFLSPQCLHWCYIYFLPVQLL
jgi:hypothetical protein